MGKEIRVAELFAGVGGFRIGLEGWQGKSSLNNYKTNIEGKFKVIWSNQWEPSTKSQEASRVYEERFGATGHVNENIATVEANSIPDHDMLVGGFPCQDYSVARTLNRSGGLEGKKGVLWWEIHRILKAKGEKGTPVKYLLLENVDRLLKSPVKQRGRDFAIILASLSDLGYAVEWRIINAAEYGFPQRRRRIFILGYHKTTELYNTIQGLKDKNEWLVETGTFAQAFPVTNQIGNGISLELKGDLAEISDNFNKGISSASPFENSGIMLNRNVVTQKLTADYNGNKISLGDILLPEEEISDSFYLNDKSATQWAYLKGAKNETRFNKALGFEYKYSEGGMIFPDPLDQPSRTIITGEGGASPSRFKHVVTTPSGKLRRLSPIELERLNMFPDNHTESATDVKRAFFMGNALVVGVIELIGKQLLAGIQKQKTVNA